jgi:hypothetical protein
MGASNDTNKELKIFNNKSVGGLVIDIGNKPYYPGETIIGNVWVECLKEIEVYGLELKVQMQEGWFFSAGKNSYEEKNIQNLMEMSVNINDSLKFEKEKYYLKPGKYNFPFTLTVPDFINPSFEYIGYASNIHLRYVIYSCLLATKGEKYSLSNINYIIVNAPPKSLDSGLNFSSCVNVHSWLFFEKGTTMLKVAYPNNNYSFGKPIELKIVVDNSRGKLNVNQIKICLYQKISLKNIYRDYTTYENKLIEKIIPLEIPAGKTEVTTQHIPIEYKSLILRYYTSDTSSPYMHLFKDHLDIFKFQPSIESSLFRCEYHIKVSLAFDSIVSYSYRPRVILPLSITHKINLGEISDNSNSKNSNNIESKNIIPSTNINVNMNINSNSNYNSNYNENPHSNNFNQIYINKMSNSLNPNYLNNQNIENNSFNLLNNSNNDINNKNINNNNNFNKKEEMIEDINSYNYPLFTR